MSNWTEEEYAAYCKRTGRGLPAGISSPDKQPRPAKYRNKRTVVDGTTYDSAREADRACELKLLVKVGEVAAVLEQVPFLLPGGIIYRADFVILNWDGTFTVEDAKGVRTKEYIMKKKLLRERGIEIVEV